MAKSKKTTPVAEVVESRMARAGDPAGATTFSLSQVPGSVTESIVKPLLTVDNMFNQTHTFEQLDNDFIAQSRANYKINPRLFFNYNSSMLVHTINRIPLIEGSIDTEIENNDDTKLTYDFSSNTYIPSNGGKASTIPTERATYKNQDVIQYKNTTVTNSSLVSGDVVNKVHLVNREIQSNLGLTVSRSEMSHFKNLEAYGEFGDATISKSLFMKPEYTIKINSDSSLGTKTSGYRRLSADFNSSYMPMYFGVDDYSVDGRDEVNGFKHKKMNYNIYTKYFTNRYFSSTDVDPVLHFSKGYIAEDLERPNDANVSTEIISGTGDEPHYRYWRHAPRTANIPKNNYESHTILLADSNKYLDREFGVMTLLFSPSVSTETGVMKDVNYLGMKRRFFTENKSGLGVSSVLRPNDLLGSFPSYQFQSGTTSMTSAMAVNKGGSGWPVDFDRYEFLKGSNGYGYNNGNNDVPWVSVYPNDNLEVLIEGNLKSSMCLVNDDIYSYIYNKTSNPNDIFMNHLMMDIGPSIDMRNYLMVRDSKSVAHIENVPWVNAVGGPRKKEYLVYSTSYMSHHGSMNVLMYSHIQTDFGCIYIYNPSDGAFPRRPLIDIGTTNKLHAQSWEFDYTTYNLDSSRTHSDDDFMTKGIVFVKKDGLHVTGKTGSFKAGSNPVLVSTNETFPLTDALRLQAYTKLNSSLDGNSSYGGTDILRYGIPSLITSRSSIYPYNAIVSYVTDRYDSLMSYPGAGVFTFAGTMINPVSLFNTPFNNAINYRLGFNPSHRAGQGLSMLCENQNATVFNNSTGVNYLNTTTDSYAGFGNNAPYVTQKTNMKTIVALTTNASYSKYSLYRPLLKKIVERSTRAREDVINASIIDIKKKKSFFDPVDNQLYLSTVVPKSESHLPIDNLLVPSERFSNIYARYETNISFIGTRDFNMQQGDNGDFYTYTSLQKDVLGIKFEYMLDPTDDRYVDVHHETGIKTRTFPNGGSFDLSNPLVSVNTSDGMMRLLTVGDRVTLGEVSSYGSKTVLNVDSIVKSKEMFNDVGIQMVLGEDRVSTGTGFYSLFKWDTLENVCELILSDPTGGTGSKGLLYLKALEYSRDTNTSITGLYGSDMKSLYNFKDIEKISKRSLKFNKRVKSMTSNLTKSYLDDRKINYNKDMIKRCYSLDFYNGVNASPSSKMEYVPGTIIAKINATGGDVFESGGTIGKDDFISLSHVNNLAGWNVEETSDYFIEKEINGFKVRPKACGSFEIKITSIDFKDVTSGAFTSVGISTSLNLSHNQVYLGDFVILETGEYVGDITCDTGEVTVRHLYDNFYKVIGVSPGIRPRLSGGWLVPSIIDLEVKNKENAGVKIDSGNEIMFCESINSQFFRKFGNDVENWKFLVDVDPFINKIKGSMSISSFIGNQFIKNVTLVSGWSFWEEKDGGWFSYPNGIITGLKITYHYLGGFIARVEYGNEVRYSIVCRNERFKPYIKENFPYIYKGNNYADYSSKCDKYNSIDIFGLVYRVSDMDWRIDKKILFNNSIGNLDKVSSYPEEISSLDGFKDISGKEEVVLFEYNGGSLGDASDVYFISMSGGDNMNDLNGLEEMSSSVFLCSKSSMNSKDGLSSSKDVDINLSNDIKNEDIGYEFMHKSFSSSGKYYFNVKIKLVIDYNYPSTPVIPLEAEIDKLVASGSGGTWGTPDSSVTSSSSVLIKTKNLRPSFLTNPRNGNGGNISLRNPYRDIIRCDFGPILGSSYSSSWRDTYGYYYNSYGSTSGPSSLGISGRKALYTSDTIVHGSDVQSNVDAGAINILYLSGDLNICKKTIASSSSGIPRLYTTIDYGTYQYGSNYNGVYAVYKRDRYGEALKNELYSSNPEENRYLENVVTFGGRNRLPWWKGDAGSWEKNDFFMICIIEDDFINWFDNGHCSSVDDVYSSYYGDYEMGSKPRSYVIPRLPVSSINTGEVRYRYNRPIGSCVFASRRGGYPYRSSLNSRLYTIPVGANQPSLISEPSPGSAVLVTGYNSMFPNAAGEFRYYKLVEEGVYEFALMDVLKYKIIVSRSARPI